MTPPELELELQKEHLRLHAKMFPVGTTKAKVILRVVTQDEIDRNIPNLVSAYRRIGDSITIAVMEADMRDDFRMQTCPITQTEPIWKRDLLHETIHEFQYKVVAEPREEGEELMKSVTRTFVGEGHGLDFYTAIVLCARNLGMTKKELEKLL